MVVAGVVVIGKAVTAFVFWEVGGGSIAAAVVVVVRRVVVELRCKLAKIGSLATN